MTNFPPTFTKPAIAIRFNDGNVYYYDNNSDSLDLFVAALDYCYRYGYHPADIIEIEQYNGKVIEHPLMTFRTKLREVYLYYRR